MSKKSHDKKKKRADKLRQHERRHLKIADEATAMQMAPGSAERLDAMWDDLSPEVRATALIVQFSPGISQRDVLAAMWVATGTANVSGTSVESEAARLIALRSKPAAERERLMPDPRLRAKLAGFFSHPGIPLDGLTSFVDNVDAVMGDRDEPTERDLDALAGPAAQMIESLKPSGT